MRRHSKKTLSLAILLSIALPAVAAATPRQVRAPRIDGRRVASRTRAIRRARAQGYSPAEMQRMATQLKSMSLTDPNFQHEISKAPMQVRLEVFKHHAGQGDNAVQTGLRRFRGLLKQNGKAKSHSAQKSFFEVTSANFGTFQKVMGKNVVWFAVNPSPGHLHTLVRDQSGDNKQMHHNTYGTSLGDATINSYYKQYALPVQLTDKEMDRFTRYLNAGVANTSNKTSVFGFKAGNGSYITQMACTNWATSAPIGSLPRWAKTMDRRLGNVNVPEVRSAGSLHAALAKAPNAEVRADIVNRVLSHQGLTKWTRAAVKRMHKAFKNELTRWPNRPADLVLRKSLAETLGVGRSQDPAKWSYDLMLSKKVPVFGITSQNRSTDTAAFAGQVFNLEIMGNINADGRVVDGRGALPATQQQ